MSEQPEAFWHGVEQFNHGDYYACHDTLEAIWIEAPTPDKNFYQGILQIAVSLYHLSNHNWRGAVILLGEGIHRLRNYQPDYGEIEVTELMMQSAALLSALQSAGSDRVKDIVLVRSSNTDPIDASDKIFLSQPIIQKVAAVIE